MSATHGNWEMSLCSVHIRSIDVNYFLRCVFVTVTVSVRIKVFLACISINENVPK